jgi:uncharacterized membrane protein YcaP (DUF421 family)
MDYSEIFVTVARTFGVYIFILVILRLSGKRTIGNFTPFDLLAAMMLAEVTEEMVFGNVETSKGIAAILSIAAAQQINSWLGYWSPTLDKVLDGSPSIVVKDGKFFRKGMRRERMNEDEVMGELRVCGVDDLREVRLAIVECDGNVSVIRFDWAKPLQKGDRTGTAARTSQRSRSAPSSTPDTRTTRNLEEA